MSPITINIGGADLGRGRSLEHIQANLSRILALLRHTAPYSEIIVLGYHNPFVVTVPGSDPLARDFNAHLAAAAADIAPCSSTRFPSSTRRSTKSQPAAG